MTPSKDTLDFRCSMSACSASNSSPACDISRFLRFAFLLIPTQSDATNALFVVLMNTSTCKITPKLATHPACSRIDSSSTALLSLLPRRRAIRHGAVQLVWL